MNIHSIFSEMEQRAKKLEKMIYTVIEGNTEDNKYAYDEETRKELQKELTILENTMSFMDNQMG